MSFMSGKWETFVALDVAGHFVLLLPMLAYAEGRSGLRTNAGGLSLPSASTSLERTEAYRTAALPGDEPEVREAWLLTGVAPRWPLKLCALLVVYEVLLASPMLIPYQGLLVMLAAPFIVIVGRIVLYGFWLDYLYGDAGRVAILGRLVDERGRSAEFVLHGKEGRVPVSVVEEDPYQDTFRLYASGSVTAWKVVCSLDPAS